MKKVMLAVLFVSSIASLPSLRAAQPKEKLCFGIGDKLQDLQGNIWVQNTELGAGIFLGFSIFLLLYNEPKPDAKPNYKLRDLINLSLLTSDPQAYLNNVWRAYKDGFVGQYHKDKCMVWKESTGVIKQSKACAPFGFLGHLYSVVFVSEKVGKLISTLGGTLVFSYVALKEGWIKRLFNKNSKPETKPDSFDKYLQWKLRKKQGWTDEEIAKAEGIDLKRPVNP